MLDDKTKNSVSVKSLKNNFFNKVRPKKKSYFGLDDEKAKYITLLRMSLSPLRAHKFKYNFLDTGDPYCTVCGSTEDTAHYLLHCSSYRLTRHTLFQKISHTLNYNVSIEPYKKKIRILLYGDNSV